MGMWTSQGLLLPSSSCSSWGGPSELPPCPPVLGAQGPSTSTVLPNQGPWQDSESPWGPRRSGPVAQWLCVLLLERGLAAGCLGFPGDNQRYLKGRG